MTKGLTHEAAASPTKRFFVSMLTRDISLQDAILDLVDNCLDGALRLADGENVDYSKHVIEISFDNKHFRISDDCGGIPRDIAANYAFKMGREPDDDRDLDTETIGMYGVGMKRAIFKMGRNTVVSTRFGDDSFCVPISPAWLELKEWTPLPIEDLEGDDALPVSGTTIHVTELHPGISQHFRQGPFCDDLRAALGEHFTLFLQKGLTITLNGEAIQPVNVEVLVAEDADGPAPYVFQKQIEGVNVTIVAGLNTGRNPDDGEAGFEMARSSITAGWSVFCNDRAVIVGDKSRLTGWGDTIPMYHPQFAVITGIVEFRSNNADRLPVTTTKRALDTSSNVWLEALAKMREAMRIWINYTNEWKNHPRAEQSEIWKTAKSQQLATAAKLVLARPHVKKHGGGVEYNPKKNKVLPVPETKVPSSRRITFSRAKEEVRELSQWYFDVPDEKPGLVGEKCFESMLERARQEGLS